MTRRDVSAHPRGRETSNALTEIRTVLSRAESARTTLVRGGGSEWPEVDGRTLYSAGRVQDRDHDEMVAALDDVIARLDRWRRVGRPLRESS